MAVHTTACAATSDCVNTPGMICSSSTCGCDATANYAAGTSGDATCSKSIKYVFLLFNLITLLDG